MGWVPLKSSQFKALTFDVWRNRFKASCDWFRYSEVDRVFETQECEIQKLLLRGSSGSGISLIWSSGSSRDLGFQSKIGSRFGYVREVGHQNYPLGLRDWRSLMGTDEDPLLRLQLSKLEVNSNLHICNCHVKRQLKLASQYTSISNWPLLTWKWHLRRGNVI